MTQEALDKLRYPIGKFSCPDNISDQQLNEWIDVLEQFPKNIRTLVENLSDDQLDTPYRPGGWTVRQVVHHVSDSHHHSYIRFKWALTEDKPVIKYYYEAKWAELPDAKNDPIDLSLNHLSAVHAKLVNLLRKMNDDDFDKSFIHPEHNEETSLRENVGKYAWHSNHHFAHVSNLIAANNWQI
ncbi:MAG: YfiT family bacillithiol transferase [bacterium]